MKKIIISTVLMTLLVFSLVQATTSPLPIGGKVANSPAGIGVRVTNLRTGEYLQTAVNSGGEWLIDWANSVQKYQDGDSFRIEIPICSFCIQTTQYTAGSLGIFVEFDLISIFPSTTTTTTVPETTTTTIPECPECVKDYTEEIIVGVLVLIFATAGGVALIKKYFLAFVKNGWGVRIYKSLDGKSVIVYHKHPGITSYHDPDTVHKDVNIRHPKGKVF